MPATVISHYRLLEVLGEGGMGVVYRALDQRLGREVAVKLLRGDTVHSAEWLARFEREARIASSLQHPHICTIHELGEHDGRPFMAMERLEGSTIRRLLDDGPMPAERVLDFARQIAEALDAAHRRGIIHRDIKPANLFVTHGDHLKILDFGLAKTTPPEDTPSGSVGLSTDSASVRASSVELTQTGVTIGTAAYMSPEQACGRALDPRSDLFSLGSVLYEMATGHRAFAGADVRAVITKIVEGVVAPPRSINDTIPSDLDAMIRTLLNVDPGHRYQSASELLLAIRAAQGQTEAALSVQATAPSVSHKARTRTTRRAAVLVSLGALLVGGVGAGVRFLVRPAPLTERDSIIIGTIENASGETVFEETLATALRAQLGQSPFLDIIGEPQVHDTLRLMGLKPETRLTHAITRNVCQRLGVKAMLDGSIARLGQTYVLALNAADCQTTEVIGRAQGEATSREGVLNELGVIAKRMRTVLGESLPSIQRFDVPADQATTPSLAALKAYTLGLDERRRGRELESVAFFNQAIELDREFASAYATLSTVYGSLGEWRRSEDYATRAYALRNRVSERERMFITYQYHDRVTGNVDLAIATLESWKSAYPRDSRPVNALALAHNRTGECERAATEAQEALRRSPGHPFPLANLAYAYRCLGRYDEARKVAQEAVKLGVETSPTRRLLYQLGIAANDGTAAAHIAWGRDRPREFDIVAAQGEVAAFEGRLGDAADLYRRASDIAVARGLPGTAFNYTTRLAWAEAVYSDEARAAERVKRTLMEAVETESDGAASVLRFRAGTALALVGLTDDAQLLVSRAEQRYPQATFVRTVLSPSIRAAIAIRLRQPEAAIEALRAATPTELGTVAGLVPLYLRAEAFRQQGRLADSAAEYDRILQHRGVDPFAPVVSLAYLGRARARARLGDIGGSARAYRELLDIWKDADPDFPPLAAARAENDRITATAVAARSRRSNQNQ